MTKISRTTDMTQSSEMRHIIMFSLPLLAGNLLQQTYNIVDTMVVGRYLGDDALAAVGATGSITYLFYTLCIGLSVGAGIIVAQYFGAGKKKALRSAVFNSALVTAIFGIVISLLSVPATRPILELLKVPDKLIGDSVAYMQIACGGTIAVAAYNWINAIMRALGDSKTPLIFLGAASLLNALLDLLFVVVFKFGIAGAAWATVLTQALSAISCIVYCFAVSREIKLTADDLHADKDMMSRCVKTGVPIAIQNGLISVSMVALQRVTNGFGETVMATYTVSMRIEQFGQQPFSSLNAAVSTFTGQNIGAGKEKRAQKGLACAIKISVIFSAVVLVLFTLFGGAITSWFVKGKTVISISAKALIITSLFYWSLGIIHTTRGFLNGAGDTNYALVNGMAEVICRIGLSLILTRIAFIGYWGIWYTTAATWFVTAMVSLIRYKGGKWRLHAIVK